MVVVGVGCGCGGGGWAFWFKGNPKSKFTLDVQFGCGVLQLMINFPGAGGERYSLDEGAVNDIRDVLAEQQRGIQVTLHCTDSNPPSHILYGITKNPPFKNWEKCEKMLMK